MGKIKKILENELVGGTQSTDVYPVTSTKAVYDENNERLDNILNRVEQEIIYDVSARNDGAVFESLSALLRNADLNTLIPTSVRHGGMSIRFIQSSDNKYVQYRLVSDSWRDHPSFWEVYNNDVITSNQKNSDLDISDEQRNVLVRFQDGEIKTKNFDSSKSATTDNTTINSDLDLSDEQGNVLARFSNGHIKTKWFDSSKKENIIPVLKNKKVAFIGDSITQGYSATNQITKRWSRVFSDIMQCTEINLGVGSTYFCSGGSNKDKTLTEMLGNNVPACAAFPNGTLDENRFISRVTQSNIGLADVIFVFGGTNDFSTNTKPIGEPFVFQTITAYERIGDKKKVAPTDTDTFCGAVHELIKKIRNINPNAQIIFMTILNRGRYSGGRPTSDECNVNGNFIQDYNNAIRTICDFYAIPVVEIGTMLNQDWCNHKSAFTSDSLHPTDLGHKRIGELLAKWVQSNIIV